MKLLKTIIAATALFGMMVSGAYADRGDRDRDHGHRYSERRGHDRGWSEHRRDRHRHEYRRHHRQDHYRYVRPWTPPPPFAFWRWDGHHRHHRHDRW